MNDKTQSFDGNPVEGHMLPINLQTGPTSDPRTDQQIAAERALTKDLESGTVRDAQGQIRNMRDFGKDAPETYSQYTKRVEGLVDFTVLSEADWEENPRRSHP